MPSPADIKHPILREALSMMGIDGGIEVTSMADIPAGTGLGSSGSFTVGVLKALHSHLRRPVTNERAGRAGLPHRDRAARASRSASRTSTPRPSVASPPSSSTPTSAVAVEPVADAGRTPSSTLEENLLLFYTGVRRSASDEIAAQVDDGDRAARRVDDNLKAVRELGYESSERSRAATSTRFAGLLTEQWRLKLDRVADAAARAGRRLAPPGHRAPVPPAAS